MTSLYLKMVTFHTYITYMNSNFTKTFIDQVSAHMLMLLYSKIWLAGSLNLSIIGLQTDLLWDISALPFCPHNVLTWQSFLSYQFLWWSSRERKEGSLRKIRHLLRGVLWLKAMPNVTCKTIGEKVRIENLWQWSLELFKLSLRKLFYSQYVMRKIVLHLPQCCNCFVKHAF